MQVRWHGHSFFTVVTRDGTILAIDPFFAAAPPAALDIRPDLVLVTHAHSDHAEDAPRLRAPILATHEVANELGRRGSAATGMGIGGSWRDGALRVWCTPAWHSSDFDWPEGAPVVPGGHPCGFVVDDGETRFYHAGDTGLFGDMRTVIRDVLRPHAAALPIGDRYTMGPEHAARAVEWLGVDVAIPMHYGTFPAIAQDPSEFARHVGRSARVVIPQRGRGVELRGGEVVVEL